jgi:hypothetical protein
VVGDSRDCQEFRHCFSCLSQQSQIRFKDPDQGLHAITDVINIAIGRMVDGQHTILQRSHLRCVEVTGTVSNNNPLEAGLKRSSTNCIHGNLLQGIDQGQK